MKQLLEEYLSASRAMGLHSGMPECCVDAFVADERADIALPATHRVEQLGYTWDTRPMKNDPIGYVPCLPCYKAILAGEQQAPVIHDCDENSEECSPICNRLNNAIEALESVGYFDEMYKAAGLEDHSRSVPNRG